MGVPEILDAAWLTGLYGPDPREVGVVDGTEDDRGDALVDVLAAAGNDVHDDELPTNALDDAWLALEPQPATWDELIEIARGL